MVVLLATHKADFFLENSRTKNSRRECRLSLCVPLACVGIPVGASVRICVRGCVYPRASVRAYVARLFVGIQAKKPYDPQKRPKFGLIRLYWYKTTKTDYKPK